ncbi:MAG: hypothetical protein H0X30_02595 [Anaerolineae bacterium]|nr:hypothetical protein [Anaerolineae bacterium]
MDFTKFVSLLETKSLFFCSQLILQETDKHEGSYNQATLETPSDKNILTAFDVGSNVLREFGKLVTVNSWHMNDIESVAMWNVYLNGNHGVAIKSTFRQLVESFIPETKYEVSIGKVNYLSENDIIPQPQGFNGLNASLWKWESYRYEQELRAVAITMPEDIHKYGGIYIPVDIEELIEKIVVSPNAPRWFYELVSRIAEKYNLVEKVAPSRLDANPGEISPSDKVVVIVVCPNCQTEQKLVLPPFKIADFPDGMTSVYSADRITFRCKTCSQLFMTSLRVPSAIVDVPNK